MEGLVYPDLSYKIVGIAFKVYNSMGFGHRKKYIQRAFEEELKNEKIKYIREREIDLTYNDKVIGKYFLDFIVENKIIIELKVVSNIKNIRIKQVLEYLNATNLKLAILIYFTKQGIVYKRIINPNM